MTPIKMIPELEKTYITVPVVSTYHIHPNDLSVLVNDKNQLVMWSENTSETGCFVFLGEEPDFEESNGYTTYMQVISEYFSSRGFYWIRLDSEGDIYSELEINEDWQIG